jgi:hypothetical protein
MTEVRLSAAVMTHPSRAVHAQRLRDRHPELALRLAVDPDPDQPGGAMRTARLAWQAVAPDATHHLVVQDDTVLCESFLAHLLRAIEARPAQAISLYTEWGSETSYAVRLAALSGSAWAEVIDDYVPTQALVLPAAVAREFDAFPGDPDQIHDDFAMRSYLVATGVPAWVTVPNLADDAKLSSVVGHDHLGERSSACYVDEEPSRIGWSGSVATPSVVPAFGFRIGRSYTLLRATGTRHGWRRALHPLASRYGRPTEAIMDIGRATLKDDRLRPVGSRLLLELWLTAYGLGLAAAGLLEDSAPFDRPLARRAIATMPDGALRFLVDDRQRVALREPLLDLVETGARQGHDAGLPVVGEDAFAGAA